MRIDIRRLSRKYILRLIEIYDSDRDILWELVLIYAKQTNIIELCIQLSGA